MTTTAYELDADGSKFIPATQRPDGTWRKPRRVREGYVPQDEVPLYESKGKQFKARQDTGLPVGMTPEIAAEFQKPKKSQNNTVQHIPGILLERKKKKKKAGSGGVEDMSVKLAKCNITEPPISTSSSSSNSPSTNSAITTEPSKRIKNLRKKLRDIEILEEKIKLGTVKNPDKDQIEKMSKKSDIINEIVLIEKEI